MLFFFTIFSVGPIGQHGPYVFIYFTTYDMELYIILMLLNMKLDN